MGSNFLQMTFPPSSVFWLMVGTSTPSNLWKELFQELSLWETIIDEEKFFNDSWVRLVTTSIRSDDGNKLLPIHYFLYPTFGRWAIWRVNFVLTATAMNYCQYISSTQLCVTVSSYFRCFLGPEDHKAD